MLEGRTLARQLSQEIQARLQGWRAEGSNLHPGLRIVRVGEHPASQVYVRNKIRQACGLGMDAVELSLPADTALAQLLESVDRCNEDPAVHGVIVQMPLLPHLQPHAPEILARVHPAKDVDGLHPLNLGRLMTQEPGLVSCTPQGIMRLLRHHHVPCWGVPALVIGRSRIVGMPMAMLLTHAHATVTVAHSQSQDLPSLCRRARLIVAAAGEPGLVRGDWVEDGTAVIDVGMHRQGGHLQDGAASPADLWSGDIQRHEFVGRDVALSPVPGGVGPMTVACLLHNTCEAFATLEGLE